MVVFHEGYYFLEKFGIDKQQLGYDSYARTALKTENDKSHY